MRRAIRQLFLTALCSSALLASPAASAADIQARSIKFPSASSKGHPQVLGIERFAELVRQKSGGKLAVKPFPGGALGPDLQTVSAMQGGTVEMTVMNASLLAAHVKEMTVLDIPFLFRSAQEADAVVDGPVGRRLLDKLEQKGLVGLAYWDLGFRQMHFRKRAVARADDLKGLKMRVVPTPLYIDFMNAMGANAVPMPFTETYTALETGSVDGMTNPLLNILDGKYDEVTKHLTLTNHIYTPQAVIVAKKFWDKLSGDEQRILREAAVETTAYQRQVAREEAARVLDRLKAKGMAVVELAPQERDRMRERAQPVVAKYTKEVGEPLVAEVNAQIEKVRGRN